MSRVPFKIAGLGVPGGGTGTLLRLLETHPEVAQPISSSTALRQQPVTTAALAELHELAAHATSGLSGVYLTSTFGQAQSAQRINQYLPEARLLLVVRHPIDCLIATYEVAKARGQLVHGESCAEFIARQGQLQTAVRYSDGLTDLYSYYGPTSLCVVLYDELRDMPVATMQRVFSFLEISSTFVPPAIAHYVQDDEEAKQRAWWWRLGAWLLRPITRRLRKRPVSVVPPTFNPADYFSQPEYESLVAWYRSDVVALSTLLERDMVAAWEHDWTASSPAVTR